MTSNGAAPPTRVVQNQRVRDARLTGLFYLGLAITGLVGFQLIRASLFDSGDPSTTLANLVEHESLARLGIAVEFGIVFTQALAAIWFYRLFRAVDTFAAGTLAAFGMVNAITILASAAFLATALDVALDPIGDPAANAQIAYLVSDNLWGVGALFFGLWLMPMGWLVLRSGWMPSALGWILIAGGGGYVISGFVNYLIPGAQVAVDLLVIPATVGEVWMVGYLLIRGVRQGAGDSTLPGGGQG